MARRRLTVKRLDPWSVLKFGIVANIVLFAILLLFAGIVWYIIDQLQLVDQACSIAIDVGFSSCGINAGNLFRALALLGGMGVIVGTAVWVFVAFLYNLIADLTGGLSISVVEEGALVGRGSHRAHAAVTADDPRWQETSASGSAGTWTTGTNVPFARTRDQAPAAHQHPSAAPTTSINDQRGAPPVSRGQSRRPRGEELFPDR